MAALFETIKDGETLLAIVVREGGAAAKYNFPTPPDSALQLGVSFYHEGDTVAPHAHRARNQIIREAQEFIVIRQGLAEARVYREDGREIASFELGGGEAVLFLRGGHSLRFLADTSIMEVKQGPYLSREEDKFEIQPLAKEATRP